MASLASASEGEQRSSGQPSPKSVRNRVGRALRASDQPCRNRVQVHAVAAARVAFSAGTDDAGSGGCADLVAAERKRVRASRPAALKHVAAPGQHAAKVLPYASKRPSAAV